MAERHLNLLSLSWLMLVLQGAGVRKKVGDWPEPSLSLWRPWALSQARVWERLGRVYGQLSTWTSGSLQAKMGWVSPARSCQTSAGGWAQTHGELA